VGNPRILSAALGCLALYVVSLTRGLGAPFAELDVERAGAIAIPLIVLLVFQKPARTRPIGGGVAPYMAVLVGAGGGYMVVFSVLLAGAFGAFTLSRQRVSMALAAFLQQTFPLMAVMAVFSFRLPSPRMVAMAGVVYLALAVLVQEEGGADRSTLARLAFVDVLWAIGFAVGFSEGGGLGLLAVWSGVVYYSLLGALEGERKALSSQMSVARRTVETTRTKRQSEREKLTGLISLQQRLDSYQEAALKADSFEQQARVLQAALDEVTQQVDFAIVSESGKLLTQSRKDFPVSQFLPLPNQIQLGRSVFSQDRARFVHGLSPDLLALAKLDEDGFTDAEFAVVGHLLGRATLLLQLFGQRERLAELVQQKSAALDQLARSQRQLIQSGKMAAVGQLAAGVAHEINSPLAAISLQTDLGIRKLTKNDTVGATKCLQVCKKASRRAKGIIENLLSFSRASDEAATRVTLRTAVNESLELIRGQFVQLGVETEINVAENVEVTADPNDLQHIFTNIILNAYQALDGHGPEPRLRVSHRSEEGKVQVRFSNNGPLIPEDAAGRLYEPFFTTKEVGSGTGLGLSLAFQMCEKNGGKLWLEQDEEVHFLVELPGG
jgi:signal transduction histidine kinase